MRHDDGMQAADTTPPLSAHAIKKPAKRPTKKPVDAPKTTKKTPPVETDFVTLAMICKELKVDSTHARVKLRDAVKDKKLKHEKGSSWRWPKGSPAIKEVRALLKE